VTHTYIYISFYFMNKLIFMLSQAIFFNQKQLF
jgi:hypothetical protein